MSVFLIFSCLSSVATPVTENSCQYLSGSDSQASCLGTVLSQGAPLQTSALMLEFEEHVVMIKCGSRRCDGGNVEPHIVRSNKFLIPNLLLKAKVDISPNTELSFSYGYGDSVSASSPSQECRCGASCCKGHLPIDCVQDCNAHRPAYPAEDLDNLKYTAALYGKCSYVTGGILLMSNMGIKALQCLRIAGSCEADTLQNGSNGGPSLIRSTCALSSQCSEYQSFAKWTNVCLFLNQHLSGKTRDWWVAHSQQSSNDTSDNLYVACQFVTFCANVHNHKCLVPLGALVPH